MLKWATWVIFLKHMSDLLTSYLCDSSFLWVYAVNVVRQIKLSSTTPASYSCAEWLTYPNSVLLLTKKNYYISKRKLAGNMENEQGRLSWVWTIAHLQGNLKQNGEQSNVLRYHLWKRLLCPVENGIWWLKFKNDFWALQQSSLISISSPFLPWLWFCVLSIIFYISWAFIGSIVHWLICLLFQVASYTWSSILECGLQSVFPGLDQGDNWQVDIQHLHNLYV